MLKFKKLLWIATIPLTTLHAGFAQSQETRQLESHEHGAVEVNLVVDGSMMFIELESPAINIVGFEYTPESVEDKDAVAKAEALLASASEMFSLPQRAACEIHTASAKWVGDDDSGEKHDEHEKEHGHDEHEGEEHGKVVHSEFIANYEFRCGDIGSLDKMNVHFFEHFGGAEEIRVQMVLPSKQTALELTAQSSVIVFQ